MPQTVSPEPLTPAGLKTESPSQDLRGEFDYRPIPAVAAVALFLGLCSFVAIFHPIVLVLPLIGTLIGLWAVWTISSSDGELGGWWLAFSGLGLSLLFLLGGGGMHSALYAMEVPEGHQRVNFTEDIAKKRRIVENRELKFHPDVQTLDGEKVFLKGYMYPTAQESGIGQFILVKDNLQCCFGGDPAIDDMILVKLDGVTADYSSARVSVAGTFRTLDAGSGGSLRPIYLLEGTHFSVSRSPF